MTPCSPVRIPIESGPPSGAWLDGTVCVGSTLRRFCGDIVWTGYEDVSFTQSVMSASDQDSDTDVDAAIAMSEHAPTMTRQRRPWFRHHRRLRRRHSDSALEGVSASNFENSEEQFTQNGAQEGLLEGPNVEGHFRRNHRVHRVTAAVAVFGHILSQVLFRLLIRLCLIKP